MKTLNLKKKGFTLVELLVVTSIFTIITGVLMIRFSLFNGTILTTNLAYDIALSVRQAQSFGINVKGFDTGASTLFDIGYGIHLDDTSSNSYILFADLNKNKKYEPNNNPSETLEIFSISGGHSIKKFCGTISVSDEKCSDLNELDDIDIVFIRPDPDAIIESHSPNVVYQKASITIVSLDGVERSVEVYSTGQISIVGN